MSKSIQKSGCAVLALALAASTALAVSYAPTISSVSMTQDNSNSRAVTISYALANGPAIVTVDVQTNVTGDAWASIGAANCTHMTGDVHALVTASTGTITWRPDRSWPGHLIASGGARAVLTAYSPENPPDYMVVDLAASSTQRVRYYASTNDLPGGLFGNKAYRTTNLVMRRVRAKGITWSMGSILESNRNSGYSSDVESVHSVALEDDYWMSVFEITQAQWAMIAGTTVQAAFAKSEQCEIRPMENVSYAMIRERNANSAGSAPTASPETPVADSYLGLLRSRTGLDFDLPTEAQWEYACRAGHGENEYGEGSVYLFTNWDPSVYVPGRWWYNQADPSRSTRSGSAIGPENGTAVCGTYSPNDWGFYDMHGNVWEYCRGRWAEDITLLNGAPLLTGSSTIRRGGAWTQSETKYLRSACRIEQGLAARYEGDGFRVACTGALQQ